MPRCTLSICTSESRARRGLGGAFLTLSLFNSDPTDEADDGLGGCTTQISILCKNRVDIPTGFLDPVSTVESASFLTGFEGG